MNAYPHYPGRRILSLNGNWQFRFTEGVPLEKADDPGFRADSLMTVPGAFDAMPEWFGKRGTGLYRTVFTLDSPCRRALLKLDGIGLRGRFRLDGREIGFTSLPYSAVEFEAGPLAAGRHELTAAVDNCFDSKAMKLFLPYYDFYGFGGFYRGAELHLLDGDYALDRVQVRTADCRNGEVELRFLFSGDVPEHLDCRIAFDTSRAPVERQLAIVHNRAGLRLAVPAFETWSPERPALHTVTVSAGTERIVERFGIREISTDGNRLLLNGKPLFLKGVNRHEFHPEFGPAVPPQLMLEDLQNLRRMNCNFVRGSHYPQDCRFLDLCDEAGLLVWEESLGWGNTAEQMADPEFIRLQELQTRLMVRGSVNHPAVILWGFLNEFDSASPQGYALCTRLAEAIREEDGSRPITFACNHVDADICAGLADVIAFNTYPGWYDAENDGDPLERIKPACDEIIRRFRSLHPNKPLMVGEMGTCGIYGAHDSAAAQWSEEFQAEYLETVIRAIFARPELCGFTVWQYHDTRSYLRSGANIRCKPLACNFAGLYDGFRHPKLAAGVVGRLFAGK